MIKILITDDQAEWRNYHVKSIKELFNNRVLIDTAISASDGYEKILENNTSPYDIIITDLQMETDYLPKMAGEWFIEQIKMLSSFCNTKIVIISASPKIKMIADFYNVDFIRKSNAILGIDSYYEILKDFI